MPLADTHDWKPVPEHPYYACACGVSGKQIGKAWPPIRDPKFIQPEHASCDGHKRALVAEKFKKYGLTADDIEL